MSEETWKVDDILLAEEKTVSIIENIKARFQWVPTDDPLKDLTATTHKISLYLTNKRLIVLKHGKSIASGNYSSVFSIIAIANLAERFSLPRSYQAQVYLPSGLVLFIEIEQKDVERLAMETSRFLTQALDIFGNRNINSESTIALFASEKRRKETY